MINNSNSSETDGENLRKDESNDITDSPETTRRDAEKVLQTPPVVMPNASNGECKNNYVLLFFSQHKLLLIFFSYLFMFVFWSRFCFCVNICFQLLLIHAFIIFI